MRVQGSAELMFRESARLSFARACERIDHDVSMSYPEAWVVDDRRISFAVDAEMTSLELASHQKFIEELAKDAWSGEASLSAEGRDRWSLLLGHAASGIPARSSEASSIDEHADTDVTAIKNGTK